MTQKIKIQATEVTEHTEIAASRVASPVQLGGELASYSNEPPFLCGLCVLFGQRPF